MPKRINNYRILNPKFVGLELSIHELWQPVAICVDMIGHRTRIISHRIQLCCSLASLSTLTLIQACVFFLLSLQKFMCISRDGSHVREKTFYIFHPRFVTLERPGGCQWIIPHVVTLQHPRCSSSRSSLIFDREKISQLKIDTTRIYPNLINTDKLHCFSVLVSSDESNSCVLTRVCVAQQEHSNVQRSCTSYVSASKLNV